MMGKRAIAAVILALAVGRAWPAERITAGFGQVPPLHYSDHQGGATGFIVDALNEAARREGIEITWKRVTGSTDIEPALAEGRIDVFPSGVVTESRQARFWVSEPWWSEDLSILTRANLGTGPNIDWKRRRIVLASPVYIPIASRVTPGATFDIPSQYELRGGPRLTASMICSRQADGALMSHSQVDDVLARRPDACADFTFQILETVHSLPLALISRRVTGALAQRLHERIGELARDGTLVAIAAKYPRTPARSAVTLAETLRLRYERRVLWTALGCALLVAVIATLLFMRQVRIQRALRHAIAEQTRMDQILRARTHELTVSNEELQAFAYSISHDLQEPLRTISLYIQLFARRYPPASQDGRNYLDTIRGNAVRMQEMMQKLLLLSRMGRSDILRIPVSLRDVLSTVLHDFDPIVKSTSAEIIIGAMPTIPGWPDRLNVLFQNLIGNALKYRREDIPPRIEIVATQRSTEWEFSVQDNGIGFDQQYADKIFGVFKRLHVHDEYGGTGVGLAIAKRVVERHGGRIWAKGRPGEGSTFYFTLPAESSGTLTQQLVSKQADLAARP